VGDHVNKIAGIVGGSGSEFLRTLAVKLEKARRRGLRWRSTAVTVLSLALLGGGVFLDSFLNQTLGDLLWLSIAAATIVWLYERIFTNLVERQTRKWRLQIIMDAIDSVTDWLVFIRQDQAELNVLRSSVGKSNVQLVDSWFLADQISARADGRHPHLLTVRSARSAAEE
jgi:hypothetical protein